MIAACETCETWRAGAADGAGAAPPAPDVLVVVQDPARECARCGEVRMIMARGLCRHCYEIPGVRQHYPLVRPPRKKKRYAPALPKDAWNRPLFEPPSPTAARPGSLEKIAVMEWRVANGYRPFHPGDATVAPQPGVDYDDGMGRGVGVLTREGG